MDKSKKHLRFASRAKWRAWLQQHHRQEKEAWLIHYKKGANPGALTYEEAVEEALCFGWIDGLLRSLDADTFALRYSPRRPNSTWSASNIRRVERLIREGRMSAAGLELVSAARDSGEWAAALQREDVDALPSDLERALRKHAGALKQFKKLAVSQKKQYLWWISSAKREATRAKRIQAIVDRVTKSG
jgi:uncharacterized protein YdeI (YjbR/CyaY-like superfamily)